MAAGGSAGRFGAERLSKNHMNGYLDVRRIGLAGIVAMAGVFGGIATAVADVVVLNGSFTSLELPQANNYSVGTDIKEVKHWTFSAEPPSFAGLVTAGPPAGNTGGLQAISPFPDGPNAAFITGQGEFSQKISGFKAGAGYQVRFFSCGRPDPYGPQTLEVSIDGKPLIFEGNTAVIPNSEEWKPYVSDPFLVTPGDHVLTFKGVLESDLSSFVTQIEISETPAGSAP